jgi:methylamine---glutamate N-methyltransferase subunit B
VQKEMREEHLGQLRELLAAADVEADPSEFTRYGSARQLYNFKVDNVGVY